MLALRRTSSWTSAPPSCMSRDAWLAASGATWEVVWRRFDLPAGRRPWLGCSALAAVYRESQMVSRRAWRYSSPTWNQQYCMLLSELSRRLAQYARDAGRVYGSCTPSLPLWRDSRIAGDCESIVTPSDFSFGATCSLLPATSTSRIILVVYYVILWPWYLTICPWIFAVYRLLRDQTLYQIWAKSRNSRLSYSDLKIENLGAIRHFGFEEQWIFTILQSQSLRTHSVVYQLVKFQHNRLFESLWGWVIDDSTYFHGPVFGTATW